VEHVIGLLRVEVVDEADVVRLLKLATPQLAAVAHLTAAAAAAAAPQHVADVQDRQAAAAAV
jgi:hypothetical protein